MFRISRTIETKSRKVVARDWGLGRIKNDYGTLRVMMKIF